MLTFRNTILLGCIVASELM
jgi:hypothetical protein